MRCSHDMKHQICQATPSDHSRRLSNERTDSVRVGGLCQQQQAVLQMVWLNAKVILGFATSPLPERLGRLPSEVVLFYSAHADDT